MTRRLSLSAMLAVLLCGTATAQSEEFIPSKQVNFSLELPKIEGQEDRAPLKPEAEPAPPVSVDATMERVEEEQDPDPQRAKSRKAIDQVMDLVQQGDFERAFKAADVAVHAFPSADAFRARGGCAMMTGMHKLAIHDYEKAFKLAPLHGDLEFIARSQISLGDFAGAVETCRKLRTFPYKSPRDREAGRRCIEAITAAAVTSLKKQNANL